MLGKHKIRGKKKNKYRKLHPDKEQTGVQEEHAQKEGGSRQLEPPGPAEQSKAPRAKKKRSSKKVHLCPLPDRYDPLEETVEETESKEEKKYKRKQKAKKYAKNVGKAFRTGCRYLIIGIQGLANAYAAPFAVSSMVHSAMPR